MQDQFIHHLIAFPAKFMEACKKRKEIEESKDLNAMKAFREDSELYHAWMMGGRNRGSFTDKNILLDIIKNQNDPYGICEGYYEYLLVETHYLNSIDGHLFEPNYTNEIWFQFVRIDEDTWNYQEIARPEFLMGTCNFV